MNFTDNSKQVIKDGDALLFSMEDSQEPSGYGRFVTNVKLCHWCNVQKRYIPLQEHAIDGILTGVDIIQNHINPKIQEDEF